MPTAKQSAASRTNGRKSHGPITALGKSKSRFNALKHGIHAEIQIMFDETAEDLALLAAELNEQYAPADPTERFLVDTLIHNEWRLRRMRRVEAVLWEHASDAYFAENPGLETCHSAAAFAIGGRAFESLQRIVNCCERNYHRALKTLVSARTAQPDAPTEPLAEPVPTPQPELSKTTSASSGSFCNNDAAPFLPLDAEIPKTHSATPNSCMASASLISTSDCNLNRVIS